jgi:hypothetical protein
MLRMGKNRVLGTVHIYLVEEEMDIRGILAVKYSQGVYFKLPYYRAFDKEEQKIVTYPHITFTDPSKQAALSDFLKNTLKEKIKDQILKEELAKQGKKPKKQKSD